MDAAQNNYGTTGQYKAMIFLGRRQYAVDTPVYPPIQMPAKANYKDLLLIGDEPEEILRFIQAHPPVPKAKDKDPRSGFLPKDSVAGRRARGVVRPYHTEKSEIADSVLEGRSTDHKTLGPGFHGASVLNVDWGLLQESVKNEPRH